MDHKDIYRHLLAVLVSYLEYYFIYKKGGGGGDFKGIVHPPKNVLDHALLKPELLAFFCGTKNKVF